MLRVRRLNNAYEDRTELRIPRPPDAITSVEGRHLSFLPLVALYSSARNSLNGSWPARGYSTPAERGKTARETREARLMDDHFLGRRVRILPTADSEQGELHAGEYGEIVHQVGSLQEGVREYTIRLGDGEAIHLKPSEVEILDS